MTKHPLKTPLRYPGGKSKAITTLSQWLPSDLKHYREPFIGGGSMAIYVAQAYPSADVWINDLYVPLYNFWVQLRDNGEELSETIYKIKSDIINDDDAHKKLFTECAESIDSQTGVDQAVSFFIMNKCSYSGLTQNSTFSPTASRSNFSLVGAEKLKKFSNLIQNWKITNIDYSNLLGGEGDDTFIFLDPPYDIKDFLYGKNREMHKSFDHERFAEEVYKIKNKFMITYNVNERLVELYKDYKLREFDLRYSMVHRGDKGTKDNVKKELLVTNYSIENNLEDFFA